MVMVEKPVERVTAITNLVMAVVAVIGLFQFRANDPCQYGSLDSGWSYIV
jgi:hypothetical protein